MDLGNLGEDFQPFRFSIASLLPNTLNRLPLVWIVIILPMLIKEFLRSPQ